MLFYYIFYILWNKEEEPLSIIYKEPKNSADILYIGSSSVYRSFNAVLAFDLYGFSCFNYSSPYEPFYMTENLIKESRKYQKPKVYIIDLSKLGDDYSQYTETQIRRTTDCLKLSNTRNDIIKESLGYIEFNKDLYKYHYFSFFVYHNRWKELNKKSFKGDTDLFKGYHFYEYTIRKKEETKEQWIEEKEELPLDNKKSLCDLLEYIKTENLNVLFVVSNRIYTETQAKRINDAADIIQENNYKVLNFNKIDLGLDYKNDFSDDDHYNVYGATKYTLYFSRYLKENYDLPDHRNDKNYNSWKKEYKRFKKRYKKLTKGNFDDLLKEYQK